MPADASRPRRVPSAGCKKTVWTSSYRYWDEIVSYGGRQYPVQLYINPETGLLCKAPPRRHKHRPGIPPGRLVYSGVYHFCIVGVWYEVQTKPYKVARDDLGRAIPCTVDDPVLGTRHDSLTDVRRMYAGQLRTAVNKRRLTKKEIRAANLDPLPVPNTVRR